MIKKSMLLSLLLSFFSIQELFGHGVIWTTGKLIKETPNYVKYRVFDSAIRVSQGIKGKANCRIAQYRAYKDYCLSKVQAGQDWYRGWRDFACNTANFVSKERNAIISGMSGLGLGLLIASKGQGYTQLYNYEKQLDQDIQDAVNSNNIHKILYLATNTQMPTVFANAMQYAVASENVPMIASLLQLKCNSEDPKSNYVVMDPTVRMLGAIKISDMKTINHLFSEGYDIDQAIEIARKVGNTLLLADLYRQKTGESQEISLALAALDEIGLKDFFAVGKRALKDKFAHMKIFDKVGKEPAIDDSILGDPFN